MHHYITKLRHQRTKQKFGPCVATLEGVARQCLHHVQPLRRFHQVWPSSLLPATLLVPNAFKSLPCNALKLDSYAAILQNRLGNCKKCVPLIDILCNIMLCKIVLCSCRVVAEAGTQRLCLPKASLSTSVVLAASLQ